MATPRYGLHTAEYSVEGWDEILTSDMEQIDDIIHTYVEAKVGEVGGIAAYKPAYFSGASGEIKLANSSNIAQFAGLSIEAGVFSGEVRLQRVGLMTNPAWDWNPGLPVYLSGETGSLTQEAPTRNRKIIGISKSPTVIFLGIGQEPFVEEAPSGEATYGRRSGEWIEIEGTVSFPITVPQGGTGVVTLPSNRLLLGAGTGNITALPSGETSQVLMGGGSGDPIWTEMTGSGAPVRAISPTLSGEATGEALRLSSFFTGLLPTVSVLVPSGIHDGGNNQSVMTDSGIDLGTDALIGMFVYNITDGSYGVITDNDATTITATLSGGTDNDWDTNDVWQVGPGPYQSGSMFYVGSAGTIRHPSTVGYTAGYYVNAAAVVVVDMASSSMVFQGVLSGAFATLDAGDCIESPATKGSFYTLHNKSVTEVIGYGFANEWIDGGAS